MAADGKGIPMINSFLNLCRVCPVPTDDKVNSEYKRNFTWHDGYQTTKAEVIKSAPTITSNQAAEPSLSRKKKHPEVAYRTHELLYDYEEGESSDSLDATAIAGSGSSLDKGDSDSRARILDGDAKDEIGGSKKADEKQPLMTQSYPPRYNPGTPGEEGVCKTTEYRSQFIAYPRTPSEAVTTARKSASMGFITQPAAKKGDLTDGDITVVDGWSGRPSDENNDDEDAALDAVKRGRIKKTEYKAKFRPFSAYTYVDGNWKKATKLIKDNEPPVDVDPNSWYSEVVERLKKADQYRVRSHAGVPLYGDQQPIPPELIGHVRERPILSPVSVAASSSRTWKDERPSKERPRPAPAPVHHRKEKKDVTDSPEHPKSRDGSTKKKPQVEKTTVRPRSAEPVIPHPKEHRSSPKHQPKSSRPRAPKDLPVHGHGDLSGKKKSRAEKSSPVGSKPRAVPRPGAAVSVVNGDDGKVWLKPDSAKDSEKEEEKEKAGDVTAGDGDVIVNGYPESSKPDTGMVNGEVEDSVHDHDHTHGEKDPPRPTQQPITKPPIRVPLTTVKSPEEVTGVRSPDPESWTVPLEIGKGLHWMDGKTPDGVQPKTPPIFLSKRFKESSLVGKSQKDLVLCDSGSASTEDTVDL